jgi:hypothetical protein
MKGRIQASVTAAVLVLSICFIVFGGPTAGAADGNSVILGQDNHETKTTTITNSSTTGVSADIALQGASDTGWGVFGYSNGATGVEGEGQVRGVVGEGNAGTGVFGSGDTSGVEGHGGNQGVYGKSTGGTGVLGEGGENGVQATGGTFGVFASGTDYGIYASAPNHGVFGRATTTGGAGVDAAGTSGALALRVTGKAQFSRSGRAVVLSGQSSIVVSNVSLTSKSLVLATPQKSVAGVFVQGAVPNVSAHTVTISLSATVGASYPVAWMVVERP